MPVSLQDSVFVETYKDRSPRNPSQRYYQLSAFGSLLGLNCTYLALFFFHHSFPSHPSRIDINLFWALLHQASAQWKAKQPKCTHTQAVSSRETVNHTAAIEVTVKGGVQFAEQPPDGAVSQVSFEVLTACRWHFKTKSSQRPRKGHCFISHFPKPVDWIGVLPRSILAPRSYVWQPWVRWTGLPRNFLSCCPRMALSAPEWMRRGQKSYYVLSA